MSDKPATPTPAGGTPPDDDTAMTSGAQARERAREEAHETARLEILDAAGILLSEVQGIGLHYCGYDPDGWLRTRPLDTVIGAVQDVIAGVRELARDAEDALTGAVAQYEWLVGGGPLRCVSCGRDIDPERYVWLIADGLPEHDICDQYDPALRARNRAATVAEDEHQAYCEDRIRSGGQRPGDVVEVTGR